jgi:tetratricopeptide (TPR) repeat protein
MINDLIQIHNVAKLLLSQNRYSEVEFFLKHIAYESLQLLAGMYNHLGDFQLSKKNYLLSDQIIPRHWQTYTNLCDTLYKLREYDAAEESIKIALQSPEGYKKEAVYNLAVVQSEFHKTKESMDTYRELFQIDPNHYTGHYNYGCECLKNLLFEEGWKYYESRFKAFDRLNYLRKVFKNIPDWNAEKLKGKKIVLYNEQGSGDLIQFVRFAKILKKQGAKIILACDASLKPVFENSEFVDDIICDQSEIEKKTKNCHYKTSVTSLPYFLKIHSIDQIDNAKYIKIKEKFKLEKNKKTKVGIVYAGSNVHPYDWRRTIKLSQLKPLANIENCQFYVLQKFNERLRKWNGVTVDPFDAPLYENWTDLSVNLTNYYETAKILNSLDLLITVDTSVAHLAGAMGIKTWLLLDYNNDWRWESEGDKTYWYPSITLFRQKSLDYNWNDVILEVKKELNKL